MSNVLYKIKGLSKTYGELENKVMVLKDANFEIEEGQIYVILGPSGSGKSTLLYLIGGLEKADEGEILYSGENIVEKQGIDLTYYRRNNLGFVFQFYNLISNLTVTENIETGKNLTDAPLDMERLMEMLELTEHRDKFPRHLSGGQQQRVAIARALVKKPKVLLCDEPTGALDRKMSLEILKILEKVRDEYGTTILIVTHNEAIKEMGNYTVTIKDGCVNRVVKNETPKAANELDW